MTAWKKIKRRFSLNINGINAVGGNMKDYEQIGNCNDTYCKYYDESMELNCSYSEDNTKCIRKENANGDYVVLGEVMAELEKHIVETEVGSYFVDFYLVQRVLSRYFA
jgi:hypothetical protein